jgi:O-methyltransferase involved in polyketide biosynthesis
VDNDPVVINHLYALAAKPDEHVAAVPADLTAPAATLAALTATGMINLARPACLILAMVLHFLPATQARQVVAAYTAALAPGSHVIITVGRGEDGIGDKVTRVYDAAPLYNHTPGDIVSFFTGLDLIPPGIVDARAWQPGWTTPPPFPLRAGQVLAGIGRKTRNAP